MDTSQTQHDPNAPHVTEPRSAPDMIWQRKPAYPDDPRYKSPALALFLSLVPGLGQVYVGYYRQGFINILVVGTLVSMLAPGPSYHWPLTPLLGFFLAFYWLFNIVDAARRAAFYNQFLSGMPVSSLPKDFGMPESHGSLVGGILLILAGLVIGTKTVFGFSLAWIQHWWPLAPILFGAYLVVQALRERSK